MGEDAIEKLTFKEPQKWWVCCQDSSRELDSPASIQYMAATLLLSQCSCEHENSIKMCLWESIPNRCAAQVNELKCASDQEGF